MRQAESVPESSTVELDESAKDFIAVRDPDRTPIRTVSGPANLAEKVMHLARLEGLRIDDGDAVGGLAHEQRSGSAPDRREVQRAVAGDIGVDGLKDPPGSHVPDVHGFVLVARGDVQHVGRPGACETEISVTA